MRQENITFSSGELTLEGVLQLPPERDLPYPAVVVCHPHPRMGGNMYNGVVDVLCRVAIERGCAALRFNFRGTGGSEGEHSGGTGEREDTWTALDYLRSRAEIDATRLGLAGYSFGGAVALNCAVAAGVRALVAVAAPPQLLDFSAQAGFAFPVLLIVGDRDQYVPVDRSEQLALAMGDRVRVAVVTGADHFWVGHTAELAVAAGDFFATYLDSQQEIGS